MTSDSLGIFVCVLRNWKLCKNSSEINIEITARTQSLNTEEWSFGFTNKISLFVVIKGFSCFFPLQTWSFTCRALIMEASWPMNPRPSLSPSLMTSSKRRWWLSSAIWGTSLMSLWPASWISSRECSQTSKSINHASNSHCMRRHI